MQEHAKAGVYNVREFGAVGDGETPDTEAIQAAINACAESGGGMVLVPPGTWLTGTIYLKSHVNLHLQAGARLLGSARREDYNPDDVFPENPVFSQETVTGAHLVIAYQAERVSITGQGIIDGNSMAFFEALAPDEVTDTYRNKDRNFTVRNWRPGQMVFFCRCKDVTVRDISLNDSPYWTLLLLGCTRARIRGLSITNPPQTPNGDGIDIDCCQDVTVSDCVITSGDDSITLRGHSALLGDHAQSCRNVAVSNCVLSTPCNAIRVGVGDGEVRECTLSNIVIRESRTGIRFNSAYSERSAHGATLENIHFSNITMDVVMPINMVLGVHAKPPGAISNISLSHLNVTARQGLYLCGNPGHRIEDIRFNDLRIELRGNEVDPEFVGDVPKTTGTMEVPAAVCAREMSGLRLSDLRVVWGDVGDGWRSAVEIEDCDDVSVDRIEAEAPPSNAAGEALVTRNVDGIAVSRRSE
jgi:polygalacturonase